MRSIQLFSILFVVVTLLSCQQEVPESASTTTETNKADAVATANSKNTSKVETKNTNPPKLLLTREEIEAGWIQLFDGESLFGWKARSNANWSVRAGVIEADSGDVGLLVTTTPFADYELRCDFRLAKGTNSGIFLRTVLDPKDPSLDCYELNLCDDNPFPTGSFVGRKKIAAPLKTEGEWTTFHVRVQGPRLTVRHDDKVIMDFTDDSKDRQQLGFIGLQKNKGKVEFRNVFLRPLETKPIFNGQDLSGWRKVPNSQSELAAEDETIHLTNGPGFLETEKTWANFLLQLDVKTNGKHLNSGLFFRAMPGTADAPSNGYEMQIHNGYKNGDRTQAADLGGTGGIVRRNNARWVIPNDAEWFSATLAANGPHIAVWIDGIQVTDFVDERALDENPRRGRRLSAGHLSLQGHDQKTDVQFRNLRLSEFLGDLPKGE